MVKSYSASGGSQRKKLSGYEVEEQKSVGHREHDPESPARPPNSCSALLRFPKHLDP